MPTEIVHWISEISPQVIVDGTYGGGGHSRLLLDILPCGPDVLPDGLEVLPDGPDVLPDGPDVLPDGPDVLPDGPDVLPDGPGVLPDGLGDLALSRGHVIGLDRDPAVSARVESETHDPRLDVFLGSYEKAPQALAALELTTADAFVLDLGLSSDQLADRERGFSFTVDGPLDLRFDPENGIPAWQWLANHKETDIANAIYQFGEERFSRRIARSIVQRAKERNPVRTVDELVDICRRCVPRSKNHDIHPATRTFQALRIAVNDELDILTRTLAAAPDWIAVGGRVAVISFHSLEDRIVKNAFRDDPRWSILTKKPLRPSDREIAANPRSRSAKLRVAQRVS